MTLPTASSHPDLGDIIAVAVQAGHVIQQVRDSARQSPTEKADDEGPVTAADLAANAYLVEAFADLTSARVITEEDWDVAAPLPHDDVVWFIDPLDGTKDFIRGGDDYAVMIGRASNGIPDVGVVHQPMTGLTWAGSTVLSTAYRIDAHGVKMVLPANPDERAPKAGMRVAVSRSHPSSLATTLAEELGATPVKKGSVGLKIGLLTDDGAELYLSGSRRIKVWDTCGPAAILMAAGGTMTHLDGTPFNYRDKAPHPRGIRAMAPTVQHRAADVEAVIAALLLEHQPFKS